MRERVHIVARLRSIDEPESTTALLCVDTTNLAILPFVPRDDVGPNVYVITPNEVGIFIDLSQFWLIGSAIKSEKLSFSLLSELFSIEDHLLSNAAPCM